MVCLFNCLFVNNLVYYILLYEEIYMQGWLHWACDQYSHTRPCIQKGPMLRI